ncbi:fibronectin type III domain-containing protein [Streptomyces sp. ISL-10]|uniref:fibronectin type III domain-containing protein n=1 Tax=Streptomyces sp. ISL-10 TaxID=2819172 RepID=UPI001BE62A6B|nr:fibronectin type III domain-containing protein [Streptomyces sp. ISL-10]MBT2365986.1 fibronectin type III domain-containing protein [Streptomyces sp. ISL-10]
MTCGSRAVAAAAALFALAAVAGCSAEKGAVRQAPASPDGARPALRAVLASPTDIDLTWSGGDGDAAGHVLEFATEEGGPYTVLRYFPPGVTAYRHPDLMPRTPFFYRLRAFHGPASGAVGVGLPPGGLTGEDEAAAHDWLPPRTDAHRRAPRSRPVGDPAAAPAGLRATVKHANGILFTWTDRSADEDGFLLESRPRAAAGYAPVLVVDPGVNSAGLITLPEEKNASYRVRAFVHGARSGTVRLTTGPSAADTG